MILSVRQKKFLKTAVSIGFIALAVHLLNIDEIMKEIEHVSPMSFVLAVLVNLAHYLVMGWRWFVISRDGIRLPFWRHISYYFKATFLNTFTPANLGGDVYRISALSKYASSKSLILKYLIRERVVGLYGMLITFTLAYACVANAVHADLLSLSNPYNYGLLFALGVFFLPLAIRLMRVSATPVLRKLFDPERHSKINGYADVLIGLLAVRGSLSVLILSFFGVVLWVIAISVVAKGFGFSIPMLHIAVVASLVELIRLVPITIQGIGLREGAFSYLLGFLGHSPEQGYLVALVAYLTLSVAIVLAGPIGNAISHGESPA